MAHKKAGGSTRNGRDSAGRRLGLQRFRRQRGTKWRPGHGVGVGKDHTIFAVVEGQVKFDTKANGRTYVSVNLMDANVNTEYPAVVFAGVTSTRRVSGDQRGDGTPS